MYCEEGWGALLRPVNQKKWSRIETPVPEKMGREERNNIQVAGGGGAM